MFLTFVIASLAEKAADGAPSEAMEVMKMAWFPLKSELSRFWKCRLSH